MVEEPGPLAALMDRIRSDSAAAALSPAAGLSAVAPAGSAQAGIDPVALLEECAEADIRMMRGSRDSYFFSDRSMTEQYALHLFRLAERDPARLIAGTARDESRTYPRPTPVGTFAEPPFSMDPAEVDAVLASMAADPAYSDIHSTTASNGDRYVYSVDHLSDGHASGLAEWASVGEKDNP